MNQAQPRTFVHPGLLNTQAELDIIRQRAAISGEPMQLGCASMAGSSYAALNYVATPYEVLQIDPDTTAPSEAAIIADSHAAYAHALMWVVTGDQRYANEAIAILDGWSSTFKRVDPTDTTTFRLESAWVVGLFTPAAEILRHATVGSPPVHSGWSQAGVDRAEAMLRYLTYNAKKTLFRTGNWGTSAALAMVEVGVFTDDRRMYDEGVQAWKVLLKNTVSNAGVVSEITRDDDHDPTTTDCGHPQYSVTGLTQAAEVAWHQGTDLYGYRIGSETSSRLLRANEFMVGLLQGGTYVENGVTYSCQAGVSGHSPLTAYDIAYNEYRFRVSPSQVSTTFTTFITDRYRPGGSGSSWFLGWSPCTHAELSR